MTPNARFLEFLHDINPSDTTSQRSKSAHDTIRKALRADETYQDVLIDDFLGGSYRRDTAIRPVTKNGDTERPDVDIYVVVNNSTWDSPADVIDALYAALDRNRKTLNITALKRNRCSIRVSTNKADMDISPLLDRQSDGYYRIGDRETGDWHKTDPKAHTSWSEEQNDQFSGMFKPSVKLLKWARRQNSTLYRKPKSFSLEAFVAENMAGTETHYGKIVHGLFDSFVGRYNIDRLAGTCPHLEDPAIPSGNLLAGVSGDAFCAYYDKVEAHRDDAVKALAAEDQEDATKYWRKIFGDRFPASKSKDGTSALKTATIMSPLVFPSKPATPPNRPEDFA